MIPAFGPGAPVLIAEERWMGKDQLGSLVMTSDESGEPSRSYSYDAYGTPLQRDVLFTGLKSRIDDVTHTPGSTETSITLQNIAVEDNKLVGHELQVLKPDAAGKLPSGRVLANTTGGITVSDDAAGTLAAALFSGGQAQAGFMVYDMYDNRGYRGSLNSIMPNGNIASSGVVTVSDDEGYFSYVQPGDVIAITGATGGPFTVTERVDLQTLKIFVPGGTFLPVSPPAQPAYVITTSHSRGGVWLAPGSYSNGTKWTTFTAKAGGPGQYGGETVNGKAHHESFRR